MVMRTRWLPFFSVLLLIILLSETSFAQQNNTVRVEGIDEVNAVLRRIETNIKQVTYSRWEYQFVRRNRLEDMEERMAELGAEGWELVNVTQEEGFILKRRVLPR